MDKNTEPIPDKHVEVMDEEPFNNQDKLKSSPISNSNGWLKKYWWIVAILLAVLFAVIGPSLLKDLRLNNAKNIKKTANIPLEQDVKTEEIVNIDPDNPPRFIQTDFVELDKVFSISKFRSGLGHDYSYLSGETCRSMKHYFSSYDDKQPNYKFEGLGIENFPTPALEKDVKIFSPVDGTLDYDDTGLNYNQELRVNPSAYPDISIEFQHVQRAPNVKKGFVKAGELIGLVLANQSFDLAIQTDLIENGVKKIGYISYFAAIPDSVFAKYLARGVKSRKDLIISKEFRDAHPLFCHDKEVFDKDYLQIDGREAHVFDLTGFKEMDAKMDAKYPNPNIVKSK